MWQAAHRLADYLEAVASDVGLDRPGAKILELGAGTGWLGMVLARNLPDAERVVATEMAAGGALEWLRRNVRKNESLAEERGCQLWPPGRLQTEECDWSVYQGGAPSVSGYGVDDADDAEEDKPDPAPGSVAGSIPGSPTLDAVPWDFIVGSDLVYDDNGVRMLPRVIRSLLEKAAATRANPDLDLGLDPHAPPPRAYYCHTKYRYELRDIEFYAEMRACGLEMKEVREPGVPTPPASPEPLSQLFPEKRVAVYRVQLAVDEVARVDPTS